MLEVLYVDDDPDIRAIAEMSLQLDPEMAVLTAGSGVEALQLIRMGTIAPDVMLLDVMMPGTTGPAVLAELPHLRHVDPIPVIFVTARSRQVEVSSYLRQGAIGVITKPFEPLTLAARVRELLALSRQDAPVSRTTMT